MNNVLTPIHSPSMDYFACVASCSRPGVTHTVKTYRSWHVAQAPGYLYHHRISSFFPISLSDVLQLAQFVNGGLCGENNSTGIDCCVVKIIFSIFLCLRKSATTFSVYCIARLFGPFCGAKE